MNQHSVHGTALEGAASSNAVDCVKLLLPHVPEGRGKEEPFLLAAKRGHTESLKVFLDSGIDVNAKIKMHEQRKPYTVNESCIRGSCKIR